MRITTSNTGVAIENGTSIGSYSNYSFAAVLYNNQRIDRKTFDTMRRYMLTVEYATSLVSANADLFEN